MKIIIDENGMIINPDHVACWKIHCMKDEYRILYFTTVIDKEIRDPNYSTFLNQSLCGCKDKTVIQNVYVKLAQTLANEECRKLDVRTHLQKGNEND